jgi:hypothetical protein
MTIRSKRPTPNAQRPTLNFEQEDAFTFCHFERSRDISYCNERFLDYASLRSE